MADTTKILIFGDICPTADTLPLFLTGDTGALLNDIRPMVDEADLVIGNLECALTDAPVPVRKTGPVLNAPEKTAATLRGAGLDVLSLANNHIRDCGGDGVMTTIRACREAGIETFGAGENLDAACRPLVREVRGLRIGLMAFAEQEFNTATDARPGAAYLDMYDDFDRIRRFRAEVDCLIVLYHGGIEHYPYPTPELGRKCRKMIECGADLVACQHSHCIGTIEHYGRGHIVYGQGNSIFGYRRNDREWNSGLLLSFELNQGQTTLRPIGITATERGIRLMAPAEADTIEQTLAQRAADIQDPALMAAEWQAFADKLSLIHLPLLLGHSRLFTAINRRTGGLLIRLSYGRRKQNITNNLIRCEAHREAIRTMLDKTLYE